MTLEQGKIYFLDFGGNTQIVGRYKESDACNHFFYDYLHYWNGSEKFVSRMPYCVKHGIETIRRASKPEKHYLVNKESEHETIKSNPDLKFELEQGKIYYLDYGNNTQIVGRYKESDEENHFFYDHIYIYSGIEHFMKITSHCVKAGIENIRIATKTEKNRLIYKEIENDCI